MNKFLFLLFFIALFKYIVLLYPCTPLEINPYESNQIYIKANATIKCVFFSFDNPSEGNIILKLAKSNSFTSEIYIFDNENEIKYNKEEEKFENFIFKYQIGIEFFKEKKLEGMLKQKYYFIIYENNFYFNDELIIYNDNFKEKNFYEINQIDNNQVNEFNYKYKYTDDNPIIIHFKTPSNSIKYLNYQFSNINNDHKTFFNIYENNNFENSGIIETVENEKEHSNYVEIKPNTDYHIKIVTDGEINIILEFLNSLFLKISPDDIIQKELITLNEYYFYIEKELIHESDEYFNEFTIKLDSTNLDNLPFEIKTNTCNDISKLKECIDNSDIKTIIKRDIDIPYIYHIYYSFNGKNNIGIKILNKKHLEKKQRIIIEDSGGNELVDSKHDKVFINNKGYLFPFYLNVSINEINDELNKNKNRILFIYTNTSDSIKIFYNEDTFKNDNIDLKNNEYLTIENYVYGFDFNKPNIKQIFGNRKYFTIMIYCPWEPSPISFQLTFINDNIHNFNYIIDQTRPINSPIKINLNSPDEKYYFIGQYNELASNILFNEVIYGKINAKYKYFNENDKISRLIYNETAKGYNFSNWTRVYSKIDIIEITCISPALVYMHFIDDQVININNIVLEKGTQHYIYLNNINSYNLGLSNDLKGFNNINIEVFVVSQREKQNIEIVINDKSFDLNNDNNLLRYTEESPLESFTIKGKGTATTIRITIGAEEKNIAFYQEYKKKKEKNKISKLINLNINNNNDKTVKLCYTLNFATPKYFYYPKDENCFEINKNDKTVITMYNPWEKYLINNNKLYTDSDSYYIIIYANDNSLLGNLQFNSQEEFLDFNSELEQNELISSQNIQKILIKSFKQQNKNILIQFSPKSNNNQADDDKYIIKSQFDEIIQEGQIYNKNNRTYAIFIDQLIDTFIQLDIKKNNKYEIKYNIISNDNNIIKDKLNDNYKLELNTNSDESYIQFKPLLIGKNVDYSFYISFDTQLDLLSLSSIKTLKKDEKTIYIYNANINTENDLIKFKLNSDISKQLKKKQWILNVLAEEKNIYNISISYDVLKSGEDIGGSSVGSTILLIFIILLLVCGVAYIAYSFFYKKKYSKDTELMKGINDVNLSMEDQSEKGMTNEEVIIK